MTEQQKALSELKTIPFGDGYQAEVRADGSVYIHHPNGGGGMADKAMIALLTELERTREEIAVDAITGQNAVRLGVEADLAQVTSVERSLAQALLNADAVARARGDRYGLCDCVDNAGQVYPSQWLADLIDRARDLGLEAESVKPTASSG